VPAAALLPPDPTTPPEERFPVTDPRFIALGTEDVREDFLVDEGSRRYVDNNRLIVSSATPAETESGLRKSGRVNGFQVMFSTQDPAAGQQRSAHVLNFSEIYSSKADASRALRDAPSVLSARFPAHDRFAAVTEVTPATAVPDARGFEGLFYTGEDRVPVYFLVFADKNALVGVAVAGVQREKIKQESDAYVVILDRRIRSFARGQAA
jgi:hypothetical protein